MILCNCYATDILVDHKAIEYIIKSKTESPTTRLKTLLLKLSEYTIELKYQKGSEMHTFKLLTTFTPHYIEHSYSHLVENLYAHKTKNLDITTIKRKCSRPPKPKPQIPTSQPRTLTAPKNLTT